MAGEIDEGSQIGRYVLETRLGGGSFGTVWRARELTTGRRVAIKLFTGALSIGDTSNMRAEVELLAATASSKSPHVVRVLGGGVHPVPHIVMEYIDGTDLAALLRERSTLSPSEVVQIGLGVTDALEALNDAGIIHRDVKPANVMIERDGTVKLADFGIAKIVGFDTITVTGQLPMTMAYAAPEVWEGAATHLTDLYAVGVLLYQCLSGAPPFTGNYGALYRQHANTPPNFELLPPETPPALREVIRVCLEKDPAERVQNAAACKALLATAADELRAAEPAPVEPSHFGPWQRGEPHASRLWAWQCTHEATGDHAVVEVISSDSLRTGDGLRMAVSASARLAPLGAARILGSNRLVLRPGEAWEQPPAEAFSFWVAYEERPVTSAPEIDVPNLDSIIEQVLTLCAAAAEAGLTLRFSPDLLHLEPDGRILLQRPGIDRPEGNALTEVLETIRRWPLTDPARAIIAPANDLAAAGALVTSAVAQARAEEDARREAEARAFAEEAARREAAAAQALADETARREAEDATAQALAEAAPRQEAEVAAKALAEETAQLETGQAAANAVETTILPSAPEIVSDARGVEPFQHDEGKASGGPGVPNASPSLWATSGGARGGGGRRRRFALAGGGFGALAAAAGGIAIWWMLGSSGACAAPCPPTATPTQIVRPSATVATPTATATPMVVAPRMIEGRFDETVTLLTSDDTVLVTGGSRGLGAAVDLKSAERYYPDEQTWKSAGSMSEARSGQTATLLKNGKILVAGGGTTPSAELYDPGSGTWTRTKPMNELRKGHTATLLRGGIADGKVLVIGGQSHDRSLSSAEIYDPDTDTWSNVSAQMSAPRTYQTATILPNGEVLVMGGTSGTNGAAALGDPTTVEVYDPSLGTWATDGDLAFSIARHTATLLSDGDVLVVGGLVGVSPSPADSTFIYHPKACDPCSPPPASGTIRSIRSTGMPPRLSGHSVVTLADGKVLVAGGRPAGAPANSDQSYLFDPVSESWSRGPRLNEPRDNFGAVTLQRHFVLEIGGGAGSQSADVYFPASVPNPPLPWPTAAATETSTATSTPASTPTPGPSVHIVLGAPGLGPINPSASIPYDLTYTTDVKRTITIDVCTDASRAPKLVTTVVAEPGVNVPQRTSIGAGVVTGILEGIRATMDGISDTIPDPWPCANN